MLHCKVVSLPITYLNLPLGASLMKFSGRKISKITISKEEIVVVKRRKIHFHYKHIFKLTNLLHVFIYYSMPSEFTIGKDSKGLFILKKGEP